MAFSTEFYLRAVAESRYLAKTHLRCISSLPRVADYNTRERRWDELKKKKMFRARATARHSFSLACDLLLSAYWHIARDNSESSIPIKTLKLYAKFAFMRAIIFYESQRGFHQQSIFVYTTHHMLGWWIYENERHFAWFYEARHECNTMFLHESVRWRWQMPTRYVTSEIYLVSALFGFNNCTVSREFRDVRGILFRMTASYRQSIFRAIRWNLACWTSGKYRSRAVVPAYSRVTHIISRY